MACYKNCAKCQDLNVKTDDTGYPYEFECLRHDKSLDFETVKKQLNETIVELNKTLIKQPIETVA